MGKAKVKSIRQEAPAQPQTAVVAVGPVEDDIKLLRSACAMLTLGLQDHVKLIKCLERLQAAARACPGPHLDQVYAEVLRERAQQAE